MKKGIILVMSCEQDRFMKEEDAIRETWAKPIINGKIENVSIMFYRGGSETEEYDKDKCLLKLTTDDGLYKTFEKTIDAFKYLEKENIEYDYVFRTNTSTYINVDAIVQFLNFEDLKEDVMYAPRLDINGSNNYVPFGTGYYLIIPRSLITNIFLKYVPVNLKCHIDDCGIGYLMAACYKGKYLTEHILQVDTISSMAESYFSDLSNSYCVRLKDEKNPENNIVNMYGLHILYKTLKVKTKVTKPHGFTKITTLYGTIPI